ncbi:MAG: hypothetical protein IJI49_00355 [Bacilli bacterium]|nr:hypothetical protein [Bacilli bacterium]
MFKNIKFFMFFILCFCLYNIKVSAIVFPEGECHYSNFVFSPEIEEKISKGYAISIRKEVGIVQQNNEKPKFFYLDDSGKKYEVNTQCAGSVLGEVFDFFFTDERWCILKENNQTQLNYINRDYGKFTSCPKYVSFYQSGSDDYMFSHEMPSFSLGIDAYAPLDEATSGLEYKSIKNDYEKSSCPKEISWLVEPDNPSEENFYCLYSKHVADYGCYIVEVNYNKKNDDLKVYSNVNTWSVDPFENNSTIYSSAFKSKMKEGNCPSYISGGPTIDTSVASVIPVTQRHKFGVFSFQEKASGQYYVTEFDGGPFMFNVSPIKRVDSKPKIYSEILPKDKSIVGYDCKELIGDKMIDLLKNVVKILRILIPIILNVFGIIDFAKAIFAGKEDEMKKAQTKFIKRLIIGVIIYLIPSILNLVLNIANKIWPVIDNTCIKEILD